ncbi:hypothetical protein BKA58DRAFT_383001 [Alternaria rosae]|uniref:uncharacterized protein n=1 Tax=Alternaria rosae TaxID=1187941 RepID=UPI001E8E6E73|nr:uncharacterized protein BKA58DRAFT_383001 [Alternaria rosae]KAH6872906.1 hypothetical protein BKA58DRAFT_383001 [Alternaria rosae]
MKFTTAAIAAAAASLVTALPTDSKIKDGDVFTIQTIRSGSDFQYSTFQAVQNSLVINAGEQNASCGPEPHNYASFQLSNGSLYLYTANPPQQFFVDRSGMGQGVIQYTTGAQPMVKNGERTTFAINDDGNLVFRDQTGEDIEFQACQPSIGGGYSVWLGGVTKPAGAEECYGFTARAIKEENPTKCLYTQYP